MQLVVADAPAGQLALCPGPAVGVAVGQHGDEVAAGTQGGGQEGEEVGPLVEQAVEVQADTHGGAPPVQGDGGQVYPACQVPSATRWPDARNAPAAFTTSASLSRR